MKLSDGCCLINRINNIDSSGDVFPRMPIIMEVSTEPDGDQNDLILYITKKVGY